MNKLLGLIGLAKRAGKIEIGDAAISAAVRSGKARLIVAASDASARTAGGLRRIADEENVGFIAAKVTKEELGGALGFASCAAVAVTNKGFARAITGLFEAPEHRSENIM